uniref:Uncharacterized protein n=1 Tax=viral metagenome TaxID=1070528 RepID=A0A6H1ZBV9_9ZZZZ
MANQDIINALSLGGGQGMPSPSAPPGMGAPIGIGGAPQGMGVQGGGDVENQINQFLISLPLPVKKAVVDALYKSQGAQGQGQPQGMPMGAGMGAGMRPGGI